MIYPADFVSFVRKKAKPAAEQVVLARIALNALYDPEIYPVDVHELMLLHNENRVMAKAFLSYCAINPKEYSNWSELLCEELFAICADGRKNQSEEAFLEKIYGSQPAVSPQPDDEAAHACL